MGTWPFICGVLRSEPLCFSEWSQQLYTMNILLFFPNSTNVAKRSHVAVSFCLLLRRSPIAATLSASESLLSCGFCFIPKKWNKSFWRFILLRIYDFSFLPPFLHSPHLSEPFFLFWAVTHAARKALFFLFLYYLIFILSPPHPPSCLSQPRVEYNGIHSWWGCCHF